MAGRSSRKGEIDWKLDDPPRQSATAEHLLRCHLTEREWFYRFARHDSRQELHSRRLNLRLFIFIAVASALFGREGYAASPDVSAANTGNLDFKQWGLLAIQDGGRRKPVDTFAKETLIRITGRSTHTDKTGKKWRPNDFVLSALVETHDWKNEPMVLISSGQLIEQLGLDKTQRRFSFAKLTASAELQRLVTEAQASAQRNR